MNILILFFATVFLILGCGDSKKQGPDAKRWQNREYIVLNSDSFSLTETAMMGNATIAFTEPLGAIGSDKNIKLGFVLLDGGFIELKSHADEKLNKGVTLRFSRMQNNLYLTLRVGETETTPRLLQNIDASQNVVLSVDIHNSESPAHILIWEPSIANVTDDNALFNSDADATTPGRGAGQFWGVKLKGATLNHVGLTGARFGH